MMNIFYPTGKYYEITMSDDPISLNYHDSLLRSSDIELLRGPHWLNDQIISFYFEYLQQQKFGTNENLLFISPEVTQLLKLMRGSDLETLLKEIRVADKDFVFFALNDNETTKAGGSHWSLLVMSRHENAFFHFDSSNKSNLSNCEQFVKGIKSALKFNHFKLSSPKCLQQNNSYDCGIHVLCLADKIGEFVNQVECVEGFPGIEREEVSNKRQEILAIIRSLGGIV